MIDNDKEWLQGGSNPRPKVYESFALPTELCSQNH